MDPDKYCPKHVGHILSGSTVTSADRFGLQEATVNDVLAFTHSF